jgi:hypothetical protein
MSFERPFRGNAGWARPDAPTSHRPSFVRDAHSLHELRACVRCADIPA